METKFTPGPWEVTTPNGPNMGWRIGPAWLGQNTGTPEGAATARLIAAAPELLEALKDALNDLEALAQWDTASACARKARAAIAKATGE